VTSQPEATTGTAVSYLCIDECAGIRGAAVVVDVMRAYTTAAWALHLGAARLILAAEIEEALALKARLPGALAMKDREPLPGFELSNSPVLLHAAGDIEGRTIVQRTTAGTVGAVAARSAERIFCAAFVNASATAAALRDWGARSVCFVVTGEGGAAEEDRACAEYIASLLEEPKADAAPYLQRAGRSSGARRLREEAAAGVPGVHPLDVEACLEVDRFDFAMEARDEDGLLVLGAFRPRRG
jgi:2-phosphosulfolactate phosphatase